VIAEISGLFQESPKMSLTNNQNRKRMLIKELVTPAAEGHGLWPWMNAPAFGRDVAPLGREVGCHELCPWGSTS